MIELDETQGLFEGQEPEHVKEIVDSVYEETHKTASETAPSGEGGQEVTEDAGVEDVEGEPEEVSVSSDPSGPSAITSHSIVIENPETLASLATPEQIETAIRRIVARTQAIKRFKAAMLSLTNVRDWYAHAAEGDDDGIPYLAESGCEKIINAFEIEVEHDGGTREVQPQDIGGYEFIYTGKMRSLVFSTTWLPVVGSRWSEDGFFTRGGTRTPDPGDVRKAAHTNFLGRGIKAVCGLKTISWEELEEMPGLENLRTRCPRIGYASGGGGGSKAEPGEVHDLVKGPHIKLKIDKEDMDSRNAVKSIPAKERAWIKGEWYWAILYSKKNLGIVLDLHAANPAVKYKLANVAKENLP